MTTDPKDFELGLYIFILAGFLGYHVITRVPPLLHTPLMSATNAMSGISLVGSLVVAGEARDGLSTFLGLVAVACSSTNVVGGFLITDRMLAMFKKEGEGARGWLNLTTVVLTGLTLLVAGALLLLYLYPDLRTQALKGFYIVSAILFILGLKGLSSPKYARLGMFLAEYGMALAVLGTLFDEHIKGIGYLWIGLGLLIGTVVGGGMAWWIPMTAVPQRTAFSHSLGALAATLIGISEY